MALCSLFLKSKQTKAVEFDVIYVDNESATILISFIQTNVKDSTDFLQNRTHFWKVGLCHTKHMLFTYILIRCL